MSDDLRVYFTEPGWDPHINRGDYRLFCHHLKDGQEHYHRITSGELYLRRDDECLCLQCGFDRGIVTRERPSLENQGFVRW